jgi:hypothetical protein
MVEMYKQKAKHFYCREKPNNSPLTSYFGNHGHFRAKKKFTSTFDIHKYTLY